ncbi:hypothetical protein LCGC14_3108840 [marine sediment metagenome]|uniref:Uncharacterized protein n=1 Tax=marine sediment metagenome TaxID=412755 RepID=A0A0F8YVL0_9ZZZZ
MAEKWRYIITFKKFKRNCHEYYENEGNSECSHSNHKHINEPFFIHNMNKGCKCSEKLCPVLKTCKKTYSNWYPKRNER